MPNLSSQPLNPWQETVKTFLAISLSFCLAVFATSADFIFAAEKININTASQEELQEIIWVGPVVSQRIIDARPFYSVDELIKVEGIGEKRLADIKEQGLAWVDPLLQAQAEQITPTSQTTSSSSPNSQTPQSSQQTIPLTTPPAAETNTALQKAEPSRVDLNTSSLPELQRLSGVGPVLAQRIIDNRPFYFVDELAKVPGIGEKTVKDIKNQGLAWVDPSLTPLQETGPLIQEKAAAAIASPINSLEDSREKKTSLPFIVFAIALVTAFFSAMTIFFIRKASLEK